jgi:hypothetical protein
MANQRPGAEPAGRSASVGPCRRKASAYCFIRANSKGGTCSKSVDLGVTTESQPFCMSFEPADLETAESQARMRQSRSSEDLPLIHPASAPTVVNLPPCRRPHRWASTGCAESTSGGGATGKGEIWEWWRLGFAVRPESQCLSILSVQYRQ